MNDFVDEYLGLYFAMLTFRIKSHRNIAQTKHDLRPVFVWLCNVQ